MLYQSQTCVDAFTYATQCYVEAGISKAEACGTFALSALPYTSDRNASCPFASEICKSNVGNILLDSGVLDSLLHLGLNSGPRFTLRHRTHCAPLETNGFTDVFTAPNVSQAVQVYRYGTRNGPRTNKTYLHEVEMDKKQPVFDGSTIGNYKIS